MYLYDFFKHVGEYLPADNQEVTHGDYEVKSTKVKSNTQFILRRLAITRNAQVSSPLYY